MNLGEIKIVDLNKSDWDRELSDPAKGKYVFRKKVYYDRAADGSSKYFPKWVTDDNMGNLQNWMYSYDASEIKYEDEDYWPEPLFPVATHGYKFVDAVLMRVNLEMWVDKIEKDRKLANEQGQRGREAFNSEMASYGADVSPDKVSEEILASGKVRLV